MIIPHVSVNAENYGHKILLNKFQLGMNQTAIEPDNIDVKLLDMNDSRCPLDVACIWQGKSTVVVNVIKNNQNVGNFSLTSGPGDNNIIVQIFRGYFLQITKVEPYPTSNTKISLSDYVVTFALSKSDVVPPLKQFKSGTSAQQVECKIGLELIIKAKDNSPACVSHSTASVLMNRGWGIASGITANS